MTRHTRPSIGTVLGALLIGLIPAFMVAVSVFADGSWTERRWLMLAIIVSYSALGFLAGWASASWRTGLWLSFPALPVILIFGESTTLSLVYGAVIAGCATLSAGVGTWAAVAWPRTRS